MVQSFGGSFPLPSYGLFGERNDRIFKGSLLFVDHLPEVSLRIAKWASSRNEFDRLRMDNIFYHQEGPP